MKEYLSIIKSAKPSKVINAVAPEKPKETSSLDKMTAKVKARKEKVSILKPPVFIFQALIDCKIKTIGDLIGANMVRVRAKKGIGPKKLKQSWTLELKHLITWRMPNENSLCTHGRC